MTLVHTVARCGDGTALQPSGWAVDTAVANWVPCVLPRPGSHAFVMPLGEALLLLLLLLLHIRARKLSVALTPS
jgi:hypothetical protein